MRGYSKWAIAICCFSFSFLYGSSPKNDKEITPSANLQQGKTFVRGELLYWSAAQEGLSFAQSGISSDLGGETISEGTLYDLDKKWDKGFSIGIGRYLAYDGWDILGKYIQFHTESSGFAKDPFLVSKWAVLRKSEGALYPTFFDLEEASAQWNLHFKSIDLELGRHFFVSKLLSLRPHLGLKGTWQKQEYRLSETVKVEERVVRTMDQRLKFWGVGIRGGMSSSWNFHSKWSLRGGIALAALGGEFDVHRLDHSIADDIINIKIPRSNKGTLKGVFEWELGLYWRTHIGRRGAYCLFHVGWNSQIWMGQNQYVFVEQKGSGGDLTLQGGVIGLEVLF